MIFIVPFGVFWGLRTLRKVKIEEYYLKHNIQPIVADKPLKVSEKELNLRDGYTVKDGAIFFYNYPVTNRPHGMHYKVDASNVAHYEGLCETYRRDFMQIGWLRLHTPISPNQEYLGTRFLSVPENHRTRVAEMISGETLITLDNFNTFCLVESDKHFTLKELLGNEDLVDIFAISKENREKLDNGSITQEEYEKQIEVIQVIQKEKFHIESFTVQGMFAEEQTT